VESGTLDLVLWHLVASLLCGIILGLLLSYVIMVFCRRRLRKRKRQSKPESNRSKDDTVYEDLDQTKMNTEDKYQSLRFKPADDDELVYEDPI
jgi:membrane protein implicated in regulation of membrane protease activity